MADNSYPYNPSANTPVLILVSLGIPFIFLVFVVYVYGVGEQPPLKPVQLATGEWVPYTGEELPSNGVASAIVSEVMRDIGYEPHYQFMSWPVAEKRAGSSKTDDQIRGSFPYIKTESRESRFYYTDPIMRYEITAFYNAQTNPQAANIKSVDDLSVFQILTIEGYDYAAAIRKHIAGDATSAPDIGTAFQLMASSRGKYIVVESVEVGNQLLEQRLPELASKIRAAPFRANVDLHLILSMKNPNNRTLRDDFNRSLARLKENADAFNAFQQGIKRKIDMARAVQLEPYDNQGIVRAYTDNSKAKSIVLPRGSRAIVKQWDPQFLQGTTDSAVTTEILVRIKLLNGPMKNHEFFVDGRAVNLP